MADQKIGDRVTYVSARGEEFPAEIAMLSTPARAPNQGNIPGLCLIVDFGGRKSRVDAVKQEGDDRGENEGFYR